MRRGPTERALVRPGRWSTALAMLFALGACGDDLPPITLINQMEVLGARIEVVDGDGRTNPAPGDRVLYAPVVALPELDQDLSRLSTLLIECSAPARSEGVPVCQELVDAALENDGNIDLDDVLLPFEDELAALDCVAPYSQAIGPLTAHCQVGPPTFTLAIPEGSEGEARLVLGIMCNRATAVLRVNPLGAFACDPGDGRARDETILFGRIQVSERDAPANHAPDLDGLRLELDGDEWEAWPRSEPPSADDCEAGDGGRLPAVDLGAEVDLDVFYDPELLEEVDGERETLELSMYATAGELERRYTVFEPGDPLEGGELTGSLTWTAPDAQEDELNTRREPTDPVRLTVVARDGRGGLRAVERYLCLEP